ncbi:MAG: hypothetical protein KDC98_05220 [Planctomycetes bacterium]|nr:hypothetical protein [Planctomycetota bacterium]
MFRISTWLLAATLTLASIAAQDPTAARKRESKLTAEAITTLHQIADALEAQRQHGAALALRKEILLEYSEEDAKARDKVGFTKVGDLWQPDPGKLVIEKDLSGDKKELKKIEKLIDKFRKDQISEHRAVAELWTKALDTARASHHWRRVLALDPDAKDAVTALSLARFQGFRGSDEELHMLRRAWAIRGAVEWLNRHEFPVEPIEGGTHPLLEKAGIPHQGYRSQNFEIWGTLPGDQLPKVAQNCERAVLMCRTIFGTSEGHVFAPGPRRGLVLVGDEASYHKVLDQCADQFDAARLEFLKNTVDLAFLTVGEQQVRFIKTNGSYDEAFDQSVRAVVQDITGCFTEGLWEGLGHAGCGALFGKTITFLLEQQTARTVASWAKELLVPDIKVWMEIAAKSAWSKSDTKTSELVLISAARFTTEQRVKAWAICDYLFHWRPELIWQLDQSQTEDIRTPPEVEAEFERRTGIALPRIDADWRAFWSRQEALRTAMAADPLGDEKDRYREARQQARELVDAVNELRAAAQRGPVGFYYAEDVDTQAALAYAIKLDKAERDQLKKPKQKIPLPPVPEAIGRSVLFSRAESPAAAVLGWWADPAWRDTMLHPGRGLLGANRNSQCCVLDLTEPVQAPTSGLPQTWPSQGEVGVPGSARVADLGPRAQAALLAAGKKPDDLVAMPWTLHFLREITAADLAAVEARVYYDGYRTDCVLVSYQDGEPDDAAAGCFACICLEAPVSGAAVEVEWTIPANMLAEDERFRPVRFIVK